MTLLKKLILPLSLLLTSYVTLALPLQPLDIFDFNYASDPQISPQGDHIVYVRNFMDIMTDERRSDLWQLTSNGEFHRPLTTHRASSYSPRFSPDGSRLAYISNHQGKTQLYIRYLITGEERQLTNLPYAPGHISWSPDNRWIAYTQFVPSEEKSSVTLPTKPKGATWASAAKVIEKAEYRYDGAGDLPAGYRQIFLISTESGTTRQLTTTEADHRSVLSFSPDGQSLIYSANYHAKPYLNPVDNAIYKIDLTNLKRTPITTENGTETNARYSPDGRYIAYLGFIDRGLSSHQRSLFLFDIKEQKTTKLSTTLDRYINHIKWAPNSQALYADYDKEGTTYLARIDLQGKIKNIAQDLGGTSFGRPYGGAQFTITANEDAIFTLTSPYHPADLAITKQQGQTQQRLTHLNQDLLAYRELATVEEIWYKSQFDEEKIQGWIVKPANFDSSKQYPLLLEIHGGPFGNYGPRFSPEIQLYAAAGYVVLYTNPRGSTSYGERFANLIQQDYPGHDYDDLMSGVDAVIKQGYINSKQLYVTGGSGGGVLTSWIVGKTNRFAAAAVAKPVINWASMVLTSDISYYVAKYWLGALPWENPDLYWRLSPLSLVGNVTTPTMLMTGENDLRTPLPETEQFYQALKIREIDTKMVVIPGASHHIAARPSQLISKVLHILDWFQQYPK